MIPISPIFFSRAPAGTLPFDIFTFAPTLDKPVDQTSFRNIIWGFPQGGTHLRVYMCAQLGFNGLINHLKVSHVAVGKLITGTYSQPSTQAVPVPFLFGGAAGFDINVGQMIESDELAFTFAPSDKLVFVFDAMTGAYAAAAAEVPNSELWQASGTSASKSTVTGFSNNSATANAAAFIRIGAR
jgi:hypothetical protein